VGLPIQRRLDTIADPMRATGYWRFNGVRLAIEARASCSNRAIVCGPFAELKSPLSGQFVAASRKISDRIAREQNQTSRRVIPAGGPMMIRGPKPLNGRA
jgi:hypothetical protein